MLIQKLRLQHGWSQEQLAELSGVSVRTIQRLERGQTPSPDSLKAIASVFQIDFNTLKEPDMAQPLNPDLRNDEALALAHVRKIRQFYIHLVNYVVVIAGLALLNAFTSPGYWWVGWAAAGWGLGLLAHGLQTFDKIPFLNGDWERREVEKVLGRKL